ncbi:MAG TPA: ABC transporter substrate-binding protein [Stellaceae bacterium]|nr:ABC transporter substrate-binding protein [Stellaceae bacterium]
MLALSALLLDIASAHAVRAISVNLCTDQLLLALADPASIASVSYLARDCTISVHCRAAATVPINYGTAEELIATQPDLVLGGRYTARHAIAIARSLGLKVIDLEPASSLDMIRGQIRDVAAALGQTARGETMVAELDRSLAGAPPPANPRPVAALYQANGMTVGVGSLVDMALQIAGFDSLARKLGLQGYMYLPLETLVAYRPDLLILNQPRARYPSLAAAVLRHPVLAEALPPERQLVLPKALWICGGPELGKAIALLAEARVRLKALPP